MNKFLFGLFCGAIIVGFIAYMASKPAEDSVNVEEA